jgi:transposase
MRKGDIATMEDARDYLEREWGMCYKNGKSLWWLFKKHRVKWKTGRRRHKKASAEQQAAFKKLRQPDHAPQAVASGGFR